jgi:hypothetical protein
MYLKETNNALSLRVLFDKTIGQPIFPHKVVDGVLQSFIRPQLVETEIFAARGIGVLSLCWEAILR